MRSHFSVSRAVCYVLPVRARHAAAFFAIAICGVAAACIPNLITDAAPDAGIPAQIGTYCGDGIITLGEYDAGVFVPTGERCDPSEAGTLGCTRTCQLDCGDAGLIDPETDHCYFTLQSATSLGEGELSADALCQAQNAHAVTFVDDRERELILSKFNKKADAAAFWVDLTLFNAGGGYVPYPRQSSLVYEPGWAATCPGCYAPSNVNGSIPKLLDDAGGACVVDLGARLGWSAFPCSQRKTPIPVLCEREPPGELWYKCNGGYCASVPQTAGKKRYLFSPVAKTADEAKSACSNDLGGSLVVFDSLEERETLLRELLREFDVAQVVPPPQDAWIGLALSVDAGASFQWDVEGGLDTSPWGDGQPIADASPPVRAYVELGGGNYDVQLAHDDNQIARSYICQY